MKIKNRETTKIALTFFLIPFLLHGLDGVKFGMVYTGESISILEGNLGKNHYHYLDNLDFQIEFDFESIGLWSGGSAFVYFLSNSGADPSSFVGDAQVTSNLESNDSKRLYELWYNHVLTGGRVELLVGLHDLNSEFYTNDCAGLFNNSSFGIGPDVSANAPVSIFNLTALGVRVSYAQSERIQYRVAVYDGDPGDPDVNNGLNVDWDSDQGLMTVVEAQYTPGTGDTENSCNAFRIGSWYHSGEFENVLSDEPAVVRGNYGMYLSVDHPLTQNLTGFFQGGIAAGNRSAVPYYTGFGFIANNLWAYRPDDVFGLGIASAKIVEEDAWEIVVEGTWQVQITDRFSLKPDFQYVIQPSGVKDNENVLQFGVRVEFGI